MKGNIIRKIEVTENDITFYFVGSSEPFTSREFLDDSMTKIALGDLERKIQHFNTTLEPQPPLKR